MYIANSCLSLRLDFAIGIQILQFSNFEENEGKNRKKKPILQCNNDTIINSILPAKRVRRKYD